MQQNKKKTELIQFQHQHSSDQWLLFCSSFTYDNNLCFSINVWSV